MRPASREATIRTMKITASAERRVDAHPGRVYGYIADFRNHHPNILPPAFGELVVEQGGVGAGTVHRFTLTLGGRTSTARVRVDEPEPGRVLTETETDSTRDMFTRFTVDPGPNATSRVRIDTTWQASGLRGLVERIVAPRMLRRLYDEELALLDRYARNAAKTTPRIATNPGRGVVFT
jgi:hypothetical protein